MGGDNTTSMIAHRAYKRLMIAILEDAPKTIISMCLMEYERAVDEHVTLGEVLQDSKKYVVHYQSGRAILISRNTPMAIKMCNEGELAQEQKDDRILRRKLQNRPISDKYDNQ